MRQIILDTETTGLDPALGHRVIEIAAVELLNRRYTDKHFHRYVNPGRDSEDAALRVHGLTNEFLSDKPRFAEIAAEFLDFVRGAELVIHNSAFDLAFINYELNLLRMEPIHTCCPIIVDTLKLSREMHPGKRNALDSLCERYGIDHSRRSLHGALLDAQLLAEVYLAMTRGQESLIIDEQMTHSTFVITPYSRVSALLVEHATADEMDAHAEYLLDLQRASAGRCVWQQVASRSESELCGVAPDVHAPRAVASFVAREA
jgi:DNA polymerase-3 subunit epsilon